MQEAAPRPNYSNLRSNLRATQFPRVMHRQGPSLLRLAPGHTRVPPEQQRSELSFEEKIELARRTAPFSIWYSSELA